MSNIRTQRLYLVRGTRVSNGEPQSVSRIKRTRPAAERLVIRWMDEGYRPVFIHTVTIKGDEWQVPR